MQTLIDLVVFVFWLYVAFIAFGIFVAPIMDFVEERIRRRNERYVKLLREKGTKQPPSSAWR
jgi:nitric oxide reductase large subunit